MNSAVWKEDNRDYLYLDGKNIEVPEFKYLGKAYDQKDVHKNSCTIHGAMTVVSNNFGINFSLDDRKDIYMLAKARGFQDAWGWNILDAVKCVRDWVKENKDLELVFYRVGWRNFKEVAKKGFGIVGGYATIEGLTKDINEDGIMGDDMHYYGKKTGGHCVSYWNIDDKLKAVNNYPSTAKYNVFEIQNIQGLRDNDVIFPNGYIYSLKKPEMTSLQQTLEEKFTPRTISELRRIATDWGDLEAFTEGLHYKREPKDVNDLGLVIAMGRLSLKK